MPDRYHIHTTTTPGQFHRIGKFGGIDWREDCSRCTNCVKPRCCYDVYQHESAHNRSPQASMQTLYECKACFSCVQGCTKGLLSLSANPEFLDMGDDYWKPDIISSTWNQADSGKIPVSGAGYRGMFHGPGFDSIWTDMSEIVRPTRDGIHGREYISTSVDVGPKPMRLSFTADGKMRTEPSNLLELPIPAVLDVPAWPVRQVQDRPGSCKRGQRIEDPGHGVGARCRKTSAGSAALCRSHFQRRRSSRRRDALRNDSDYGATRSTDRICWKWRKQFAPGNRRRSSRSA